MREIKFRAWDGKEMLYEFSNSSDLNEFLMGGNDGLYKFMQYTGLKDKNGKEIYEGDVIRKVVSYMRRNENKVTATKVMQERKTRGISIVEYQAPQFILHHHPEGGSDFIRSNGKYEIIGNIYMNPDLLTNNT